MDLFTRLESMACCVAERLCRSMLVLPPAASSEKNIYNKELLQCHVLTGLTDNKRVVYSNDHNRFSFEMLLPLHERGGVFPETLWLVRYTSPIKIPSKEGILALESTTCSRSHGLHSLFVRETSSPSSYFSNRLAGQI